MRPCSLAQAVASFTPMFTIRSTSATEGGMIIIMIHSQME